MHDALIKSYLTIAEHLTATDDTERALKILELLPAKQRDSVPPKIAHLRNEIKSKIKLSHDYYNEYSECDAYNNELDHLFRGQKVLELALEYQTKGQRVNIIEFGAGNSWLKIGLEKKGILFNYASDLKNPEVNGYDPELPTIFVAFEVIEHLHSPEIIADFAARFSPDHVFLSTPTYTFGEGQPSWRITGIQHLRTYTPSEFTQSVIKMFPGAKEWFHWVNAVQVLRGDFKKT